MERNLDGSVPDRGPQPIAGQSKDPWDPRLSSMVGPYVFGKSEKWTQKGFRESYGPDPYRAWQWIPKSPQIQKKKKTRTHNHLRPRGVTRALSTIDNVRKYPSFRARKVCNPQKTTGASNRGRKEYYNLGKCATRGIKTLAKCVDQKLNLHTNTCKKRGGVGYETRGVPSFRSRQPAPYRYSIIVR